MQSDRKQRQGDSASCGPAHAEKRGFGSEDMAWYHPAVGKYLHETGMNMSEITDAELLLIKDKVEVHEQKIKEHDKLINEIKVQNAVQNNDLRRIVEGVSKIEAKVSLLREKPGERWEMLIGTIITGIATALVVALMIKLGLPR